MYSYSRVLVVREYYLSICILCIATSVVIYIYIYIICNVRARNIILLLCIAMMYERILY